MRKLRRLTVLICLWGAMLTPWAYCQNPPANFTAVQAEMDGILEALGSNIDRFEAIKNRLMDLGRANADYDEQKNIWLSSNLTLAAISAICQYENDLLTLFMDLREKNRRHYDAVRVESLETSIRQITIMYRQMQINNGLITPGKAEQKIIETENGLIESSLDLLKRSLDLIRSLEGQN